MMFRLCLQLLLLRLVFVCLFFFFEKSLKEEQRECIQRMVWLEEDIVILPTEFGTSFCVRQKGERKLNSVFASRVFRVGVPVYGYAEVFEIAVRTPKWPPPRLIFCRGMCRPGNWCELMTTSDLVFALVLGYFYIH